MEVLMGGVLHVIHYGLGSIISAPGILSTQHMLAPLEPLIITKVG